MYRPISKMGKLDNCVYVCINLYERGWSGGPRKYFERGIVMRDTPFVERAYNLGLKAVPNFCKLTLEQLEYYEQHLNEIPTALARGFIVPELQVQEKFGLLVDLGVIIVPQDYDHVTRLTRFRKEGGEKFWYYNRDITDEGFTSPSRILRPGDRLWVRVFKQVVLGETTAEERMAFLAMQNASHTGAQGASLVFELKGAQLPKDKGYASFDEKGNLLEDADRSHQVPLVYAYSGGEFSFYLVPFEHTWSVINAFFCFCDVE